MPGGGGAGHSPMDIFDMFFGGMRGPRAHERERRGRDMVHPLKVSLEELYNGATRQLALNKNVICSKCNGKGGSWVEVGPGFEGGLNPNNFQQTTLSLIKFYIIESPGCQNC